jgi:hypothetical protein
MDPVSEQPWQANELGVSHLDRGSAGGRSRVARPLDEATELKSFGGSRLTLRWFRAIRIAAKLGSMSWARGADLDPAKESLYADFLGAEWDEVEPGIFIHGDHVELAPPRVPATPAVSQ